MHEVTICAPCYPAQEIKKGMEKAGISVDVFQVPETLDDEVLSKMGAPPKNSTIPTLDAEMVGKLNEYDGFVFGIPTRFGVMSAQMKAFFDMTGSHWMKQSLSGKPAATFVSTGTQNGGQELTHMQTLSPDVTLVVHLGRDYLAMGLEDARCQVRPSEALRGAMAFLASEAARGHAVVDPCCGQGSLLKLAQELWPKEPSRMLGQDVRQAALARAAEIGGRLELSRGDGGDLPLGDGEADAFFQERSLLCQRVVAEASRVLRPDGRLVLMTGSPELLAQEVVKGAWRTVGAWPIRRRRATRSEEKVEQLVCLEKAAEEPKKAPKDLALKEDSLGKDRPSLGNGRVISMVQAPGAPAHWQPGMAADNLQPWSFRWPICRERSLERP
eukprot:g2548.t1